MLGNTFGGVFRIDLTYLLDDNLLCGALRNAGIQLPNEYVYRTSGMQRSEDKKLGAKVGDLSFSRALQPDAIQKVHRFCVLSVIHKRHLTKGRRGINYRGVICLQQCYTVK